MREASKYENLIPNNKVREKKKVSLFDSSVYSYLPKKNSYDNMVEISNYKSIERWVKAFDCYVDDNILDNGKSGESWVGMGECSYMLGEYKLAELLTRKGISVSKDRHLSEKFSKRANEIRDISMRKSDIKFSIENRKKERKPPVLKKEHGFRLGIYEFEEVSEVAKIKTQKFQKTSDFFELSKEAYINNNIELAIEIMKAAVNHKKLYSTKAAFLHMAAKLLFERKSYDEATIYLKWATELSPNSKDIQDTKHDIIEFIKDSKCL